MWTTSPILESMSIHLSLYLNRGTSKMFREVCLYRLPLPQTAFNQKINSLTNTKSRLKLWIADILYFMKSTDAVIKNKWENLEPNLRFVKSNGQWKYSNPGNSKFIKFWGIFPEKYSNNTQESGSKCRFVWISGEVREYERGYARVG